MSLHIIAHLHLLEVRIQIAVTAIRLRRQAHLTMYSMVLLHSFLFCGDSKFPDLSDSKGKQNLSRLTIETVDNKATHPCFRIRRGNTFLFAEDRKLISDV